MSKKVAIVTGSASGIGAASALELSKRGWSVVINYSKSADEAKKVAAKCKDAIVVQADVGEDAECKKLVKAAIDKWGRLDALVNNAGTTKFVKHSDLDGLSADDFLRIYRLNVVGPFQMVRAASAALKAAKGSIVNVSSVASQLGTGSSVAYAASKAALNAMTFSLARSLGPEVRVNAVLPGYVDTPWQWNALGNEGAAKLAQHYAGMVPLKDFARPEDVADAIVWLIEGARQVTGETIYIDGGMHITPPR
ncbi:MAG TPA: SDR family oxidoreductase [Burkholderiales bacterium]|jgi:3-oxoacyl-[acyl-carrier protein] reductase|nr:SDR family oxidoreductase [Burkholderiales bacterium]